jgi:hypothetical protein
MPRPVALRERKSALGSLTQVLGQQRPDPPGSIGPENDDLVRQELVPRHTRESLREIRCA